MKSPGSKVNTLKSRVTFLWQKIQTSRVYRTNSRFTDVGGNVLTGGMSFQALFAVFAALWVGFGFAAIWLKNRPDLINEMAILINTYVPGLIDVDGTGAVPLEELLNRSGLTTASAIASVSLIWVSMNWFTGTRRSIRLIFGLEVKQYKNAVLLKLRDFAGALIFFAALLLSAALTIISSNMFTWLLGLLDVSPDNWLAGGLGTLIRLSSMLIVDVLILMAIHWFLAEVKVPFRALLSGSLLGGLALLGLKTLGTALLGGASSNPLIAIFAVVAGLLIWFNLISRVLLLTSAWIATGLDKELGLPEKLAAARA